MNRRELLHHTTSYTLVGFAPAFAEAGRLIEA
jgi:hypothetical protein